MEGAEQGSPGLRSGRPPASADQEGLLELDPARTEASEDRPAQARGGGQPPDEAPPSRWRSQKSPASSSETKPSAGASPAKHLGQDEPGGRSRPKAGTAPSRENQESEQVPEKQTLEGRGGAAAVNHPIPGTFTVPPLAVLGLPHSVSHGLMDGSQMCEPPPQGSMACEVLRNSTHPPAVDIRQILERFIQFVAQLFTEKQQSSQGDLVVQLSAENQRLPQELQELKSSQRAPVPQRAPRSQANWIPFLWNTVFPVQLLITGQTKGCEKDFMDDVTRLLAGQGVSLQVEDYQENSEQFLLLFCPIASRIGTDINNALEGLSSIRKALLVVCHFKPKGSVQSIVSSREMVQHPALVTTVHACYTIQDGFYDCQMNKEAAAAVAAAIARELRGD
ncbi:uncharacterized protein [Tiliqua scincoides]|uniref:uncharacterized protein isoform X2 n=1 Tax=Tiliqua scincoides TaxID=71010 RepID=UPI003462A698